MNAPSKKQVWAPCYTKHGQFKDRIESRPMNDVPDEEFERIFGKGTAHRLNIMTPEERELAMKEVGR